MVMSFLDIESLVETGAKIAWDVVEEQMGTNIPWADGDDEHKEECRGLVRAVLEAAFAEYAKQDVEKNLNVVVGQE